MFDMLWELDKLTLPKAIIAEIEADEVTPLSYTRATIRTGRSRLVRD
jgi:hypothetical protein